jgi:hypothetical protein
MANKRQKFSFYGKEIKLPERLVNCDCYERFKLTELQDAEG